MKCVSSTLLLLVLLSTQVCASNTDSFSIYLSVSNATASTTTTTTTTTSTTTTTTLPSIDCNQYCQTQGYMHGNLGTCIGGDVMNNTCCCTEKIYEWSGYFPANVTSAVDESRTQLASLTPITGMPIVGPMIKSSTDSLLDWLQQEAWRSKKDVPGLGGTFAIKNWMFMAVAMTFILLFTRKSEHRVVTVLPY
jgi:hypothetical protein